MAARTRGILLAAFLLLPTAAWAQQDRFNEWDRNGDGRISREELPERIRRNFDRVDADCDGFISRAEHEAVLKKSARRRQQADAPSRAPAGTTLKADLPYAGTDNPRQKLDLLLPEKPATGKPLPVIAYIHGGGWRGGDKRSGISRIAPLVATGHYAGATIAYRLSGEARWPAQIHDCKAAVRWLRANAKSYNLDPDRIGVWGGSAGGHLVAMLGVSGGVETLEGDIGPHVGTDSRVTCVVDWFGPTELLTMGDKPSRIDHDAATSPESLLIGGPIQKQKEKARAASPITYVTADDAPILIMHGTKDELVPYDQSVRFHAALKQAGVDSTFVTIEEGGHGFRGKEIDERVAAFLDKVLRGRSVEVSDAPIRVEPRGRR